MSFRTLALVMLLLFPAHAALAQPASAPATQPVKIIFDTDMDSDCDDVGALAILHAMADRGEAQILATIVSSRNPYSAPCVEAINTYYGRPGIPIGATKLPHAPSKPTKYGDKIAARFPHRLGATADAPDAMAVYRKILTSQPDHSVVLCTVGYLTNIANLLKLPPTVNEPSGANLVKAKVKLWACMGGNFVGSPAHDDLKLSNHNFTFDKAASIYAVDNFPAALVFVGREIGSVPSGLKVGASLRTLPETNPIRMSYQFYFGGVEPRDRHVADPTTVLFAVRGLADYWAIHDTGHMDLQPDNTFTWSDSPPPAPQGPRAYLLKRLVDGKPNDRQIERVIDDLMHQPPRAR